MSHHHHHHHKQRVLTVMVVGVTMIVLAATAYAATGTTILASHAESGLHPLIFGGPGTAPALQPNCGRKPMWVTPAGKSWAGAQPNGKTFVFATETVIGTQLKCLIHRIGHTHQQSRDTCWAQAGPVPVVHKVHKDDWTGVDALQAWTSRLAACEAERNAA